MADDAKPDPEGVEAAGPELGIWYMGQLEEKHDGVIAVSFEKKQGGRFTVVIDKPKWNCSPEGFEVGDPIAVRFERSAMPFDPVE